MRRQYRLKSTIPAWILFGAALLCFGIGWILLFRYLAKPNVTYENWFLTFRISSVVSFLLGLIPYVLWGVFLTISRKSRDPHLPLTVYFAYYALVLLFSVLSAILQGRAGLYSRPAATSLAVTYAAWLLAAAIPCLLNSLFFRKKQIYIVAAALLTAYQVFCVLAIALQWTRPRTESLQLTDYAQIFSAAAFLLFVLSWLLYALAIHPVQEKRPGAAPTDGVFDRQRPMHPQPAPVPAAAPAPAPAPGPADGSIFCTQCGVAFPAVGKFCPKCGAKRFLAE